MVRGQWSEIGGPSNLEDFFDKGLIYLNSHAQESATSKGKIRRPYLSLFRERRFSKRHSPRFLGFVFSTIRAMFSGVSGIGSGSSSGGRPTGRLGRASFATSLEFFGFRLGAISTPHCPHYTAAQEGGQNRGWDWPEGNDLHHLVRFRNGEWQTGMRRGGSVREGIYLLSSGVADKSVTGSDGFVYILWGEVDVSGRFRAGLGEARLRGC